MQRNELVNWANVMGFDASTIPNDSKLEAHLQYLQNNASTMAGTLATGTLTSTGTAATDGDQVKIGDITYTFVTALSEAKATAVFTLTDVLTEGETITIEGITYTMRATPTAPYDVDIGASAAISLDNLKAAINDSGTEGTTYGTGTEAHPLVTATTNTNTEQTVEAKKFGTYANGYLTSETCADASWGGNLAGGVDPVPFEVVLTATAATELDNLKAAINDSGTEGTTYSTGTYAHPQVTATTNTDTTQVVAARDMAVGEDISTTDPTDDGSVLSWGATTLASGVADQNAVDATSVAQTGLGQNANV